MLPFILFFLLLVLLLTIGYIYAQRLMLRRQYAKKQIADKSLYRNVLQHVHQSPTEKDRPRVQLQPYQKVITTIQQNTHFPPTQNDRIQLLRNGEEKYPALFTEIKKATHHIHLLYYIVQDDPLGRKLQKLLIQKAKEGIQVRILVDGVGSRKFIASPAFKQLQQAGVHCAVFAPVKLSYIPLLNYRNHRKIVVIDGKVGFSGGLNIGEEYLHKDPQKGYWRDIHLLLEGEAVLCLQYIFATDWYYATQQKLMQDKQFFPFVQQNETSEPEERDILAQVAPSGPDMPFCVNQHVYREMILAAKKRVYLATPYFTPDKVLIQALKEARQKGVEVTLLVPKRTDNPFIQYASFHYYPSLLQSGVTIFQYEKGFYHAKIALIDDQVASIGSVNLDQRSFYLSLEAGVFIYHQEFCQQLEQVFKEDIRDSKQLHLRHVQNRGVLQRMATQVSLLLVPLL